MDTEVRTLGEAVFRPVKRRRFTKNRPKSEDEGWPMQGDETMSPEMSTQIAGSTVSDTLRLHKNRARMGGIVFSATTGRSAEPPAGSTELAAIDDQREQILAMSDRFAAHSGQVVDVNKHMVAYIESEMAKRRLGQAMPRPSDTEADVSGSNKEDIRLSDTQTLQRQPAAIGKIHEIDLGQDTSLRNKERTELAIRRARGEDVPAEQLAVVKKVRLGRNGKPRRGPKPRDVEDVKRDQLVEQVLHETRLEIYDEPSPSTTTTDPHHQQRQREEKQQGKSTNNKNDDNKNNNNNNSTSKHNTNKDGNGIDNDNDNDLDGDGDGDEEDFGTDDRVAAQFRHEFMEAMQARHRHRAAMGQARQQARQARRVAAAREQGQHPGQAQGQEQSSRGPKLGGSRSARAAMRAQIMQEKLEKGGKK